MVTKPLSSSWFFRYACYRCLLGLFEEERFPRFLSLAELFFETYVYSLVFSANLLVVSLHLFEDLLGEEWLLRFLLLGLLCLDFLG